MEDLAVGQLAPEPFARLLCFEVQLLPLPSSAPSLHKCSSPINTLYAQIHLSVCLLRPHL